MVRRDNSVFAVRYIPEWMIGGGFHKDARTAFTTCQQILHGPMEKIKREMVCKVVSRVMIHGYSHGYLSRIGARKGGRLLRLKASRRKPR